MNHEEIVNKYSATHNAAMNYGSQAGDQINAKELERLRREHTIATRDYIASLKERNQAVPAGLEDKNKYEFKIFFKE